MTDKQILDIASERVFLIECESGTGNVILQNDIVWIARELEKAYRDQVNLALLKVWHLIPIASRAEFERKFYEELKTKQ